jgi:corrinoid protein of di/trimethylamine methyltransferase
MKEELLETLSEAVVRWDDKGAERLSREALDAGMSAWEVLSEGIMAGMKVVSDKYESGEYFVPELLLCSDALYAGLEVLRPHLGVGESSGRGRVVMGVVEGDTHDIGKNIVKIMLEGSGFEVVDLGRNVPLDRFVEAAVEHDADVIGLSTLMTTAMAGMSNVVEVLARRGDRHRFKVIVGGAPVSQVFADKIGADGYAPNAPAAVRLVKSLTGAV